MRRLDRTPVSSVPRPTRRGGDGAFTCLWGPALAALLVAAMGCREDAQSPTAPEAAPSLTAATPALAFYQMSAGWSHSCGVTTDQRAFCWGFYGLGPGTQALGDGSTNASLTPVAVAGGLGFRQVSASFTGACGVTLDRRAYCWGANDRGQLGDGSTTLRLKPVAVAGGHLFRQVETTFQHTCGVSYPDDRLYCWGDNFEAELGDGTRTNRLTPVAVASTLRFRRVTTGYDHTCGVTTDNRAFCWGRNRYGQVGDSSTAWRRLKPTWVARGLQFHQVDAGREFTCATTTDDRAFCWGRGSSGQLGNGTTGSRRWPRAVAGGLHFDRVSAGAFHTCGVTTGNRAYCWGTSPTFSHQLSPLAVAGGLTFAQVSAGSGQTCGRTPAYVAYCWGGGFRGELGNGSSANSPTPVPVAGPN
jgi:alpha-tubulin suppressor-like RCC1 family protein